MTQESMIFILLVFRLLLSVNSLKTGAELNGLEEIFPKKIVMKDEQRRQDLNVESLRAMNLCIQHKDQKEKLITCDRRHLSKFACIGAWDGKLRKCDEFSKKKFAAAICVQVNSSYVVICDHKNFKSSVLCFSRDTLINNFKEFYSFRQSETGLTENIRPCNETQRRLCLKKGKLLPCSVSLQNYSKNGNLEKNIYNPIQNTESESYKTTIPYYNLRPEKDKLVFTSILQNESDIENPSRVFNKDNSKPKLKCKIKSVLKGNSSLSHFGENKSVFDCSKLNINFSSKEKASQFISYTSNLPYGISTTIGGDKNGVNINYEEANVLSTDKSISESTNHKKSIPSLDDNQNKTETTVGKFKFSPSNLQSSSKVDELHINEPTLVLDRTRSNYKLNANEPGLTFSATKPSSHDLKLKLDESVVRKTVLKYIMTEKFPRKPKNSNLVPKSSTFSTKEDEHSIQETKLVLDGTISTLNLTADKPERKFSVTKPSSYDLKIKPDEALIGNDVLSYLLTEQTLREPKYSDWTSKLSDKLKQSKRRSEAILHDPMKLARLLGQLHEGFKRGHRKPRAVQQNFRKSRCKKRSPLNEFFHVLKCVDCDIIQDIIVDESAEVETFTFKS